MNRSVSAMPSAVWTETAAYDFLRQSVVRYSVSQPASLHTSQCLPAKKGAISLSLLSAIA